MKWKKNKTTENQGILYVRNQVNEQGSIYRTVHQETDIGIDGFIELVASEEATGLLIGIQIKSGDSYLNSKKNGFELPIDIDHLNYWKNYHLPVYLIMYSPSLDKAAYVSIKAFIEQEEYHDRLPITKIEIPLYKEFNSKTIIESFPKLINTYRDEQMLFECIEGCISGNLEEQKNCFQIISNHPYSMDRKITLYIASKMLMHENEDIAKSALHVIGYGVGRNRWSWNPNNQKEKSLISYAVELSRKFNEEQIRRIIYLVENEDFHGPHALGERAYDILHAIGDKVFGIMKNIMRNPKEAMESRANCMYLIHNGDENFLMNNKENFLEDIYLRKVYLYLFNQSDELSDNCSGLLFE
ncbi:MAG: DUF4365 domain-containing protein [Bacteroidia bacterium]